MTSQEVKKLALVLFLITSLGLIVSLSRHKTRHQVDRLLATF